MIQLRTAACVTALSLRLWLQRSLAVSRVAGLHPASSLLHTQCLNAWFGCLVNIIWSAVRYKRHDWDYWPL